MLGGLGEGTAAPGAARIGVADGTGQSRRDLAGATEAGAEVGGQGEQRAPALGGVEFVAAEAVR